MPIDVSMYGAPQTAPAPQNPLTMVSEYARANNAMNQARAFEREFRARDALGPMLKASIQQDGSIDTAKLFQMVAAHPDTGWKLPDLVEGFLRNQLTTARIANANLEIAGKHTANLRDINTMMVTKAMEEAGGDAKQARISRDDYLAGMARGIPLGLYTAKDLTSIMLGMDIGPKKNPDEEAQQGRQIFQHAFATANSASQANETINKTLGLGNTPVDVYDQDSGQIVTRPAWQAYQMMGPVAGKSGTAAMAGAGGPAAGAPAAGGAPALPGGGPQVPGAAPGAAPGAPAGPGAGFVKAPSKFTQDLQGKFTDYYGNLQAAAAKSTNIIQVINELRESIQHHGLGPGMLAADTVARFFSAVGMQDTADRIVGGNRGALVDTEKQTLALAVGNLRQQLLASAGEGSAGRLAVVEFQKYIEANPNILTDRRAFERMLSYADMIAHGTLYEQRKLNEMMNPDPKSGRTPLEGPRLWTWPATWNGELATNPKLQRFMRLSPWENKTKGPVGGGT